MEHGTKIIVKKGGKLVIDGGTISSDCKMWQGILVQGNQSYNQTDETKQGVLEMKNGATIENAEAAIYVGQYFMPNSQSSIGSNYGNGIIKIENSNFLNNQKDIVMRPNVLSLIGSGNITFFSRNYVSNCTFKNDANMLTDAILNKGKMESINLNGVFKINMIGNTFENLDNSISLSENWDAIVAQNSGLIIEAGSNTIPNNYNDPNQFINLRSGVRAINSSGSSNLISINHCEFTNTYHSIFLSGTNNAEVLLNNIQVPDQAPVQAGQPDPGAPYGIYLNGGRGFRVEENTLWRPSSNGSEIFNGARGIIVHNTGGVNNEIYKNTTNNLFISEQAQGFNSGLDTNNVGNGLKYLCNNSQTTESCYDFKIFGPTIWLPNPDIFHWSKHQGGIAETQQQVNLGSTQNPYLPAGNIFSSSHASLPATAVVDFDNYQARHLYYAWDNPLSGSNRTKPEKKANLDFKPIDVNFDVCPSKINSGGSGSAQLYAKLFTATSAYNTSKTLYNIWKDGGNIELGEQVATTDPWDAYVQFNMLMAESPYITEEVLIEMINNPVFSSLMVKLLMIANPHAVNSPEVMNALENRNPAMPQVYIDEIKSQPRVTTQLKVLEGNMEADNHAVSSIVEEIKLMYRQDTMNSWTKDSLIAIAGRQKGLYDRYEMAAIYLSFNMTDEMQATLTAIESSFELDDEMLVEFTNFETLLNLVSTMNENEVFENFLDEEQKIAVEAILVADMPMTAPIALSILLRDNPLYVFQERILDVEMNSNRMVAPHPQPFIKDIKIEFKLYPNPAFDYTTLKYNCKYKNLTYTISNMEGKVVEAGILPSYEDMESAEVIIGLTKLPNGTYSFDIKTAGVVVYSDKIVINK